MKLSRSQLADYLVAHNNSRARELVAAYLVENGRSRELDQIIRQVEAKLLKRGRAVAHTTSARKLEADQQRQVIALLKQNTNINSVEIINDVDPSLMGGVIVRTPESEVDLSVRSRLNRLKRA